MVSTIVYRTTAATAPMMKKRRKIGLSVRRCMYQAATMTNFTSGHAEQQHDDQAVGDVALEVVQADLDRGDHARGSPR